MSEEKFDPQNSIPSNTERPSKGHNCGICQKWFKRSSDLRRHGSVHSKEKPISCDHCNLRFASKNSLFQHRKYLSLEKTYQCEFCPKSFKMFSELKVHVITHTEERPYKCEMCNKNFRRKDGLDYHYGSQTYRDHHMKFDEFKQFEYLIEKYKSRTVVVHDGSVHVCTVCNKEFKSAKLLKKHSVTHYQGWYECDLCGLRFKSKEYVVRHKRSMHSTRRELYPCEICNKKLSSKYSVKLHKTAVHKECRSIQCEVCPRSYRNKSSLAMHMKVHSGVKKYTCIMCDKSYKALSGLKYHMREHTGEKPYICESCNACFKSNAMRNKHSKRCGKTKTTLETEQDTDSKLGVALSQGKNTYNKIGFAKFPEKIVARETVDQATFTTLQAAKEAISKGDKVFTSQNIKFIKLPNAAELNFLRVTRLFQRYRCLSNVYSK